MYFTDEQIEMARKTDLVDLLRRNGQEFTKSGREWRWEAVHSITIKGNVWFKHDEAVGGDAIDFVERFFEKDFLEAVKFLLDESNIRYSDPCEGKVKIRNFVLPKPYTNMSRVYAYLMQTRGIDGDVITTFVKDKKIYEEKNYHNVVFVGFDEKGDPQSACVRGTITSGKKFRMTVEDSDLRYNFSHKGESDKLYVFESPIDMLSFICLNKVGWKKHSYISLSGLGERSMLFFLQSNPQIREVCLALDNDEAGINARTRMESKLKEMKYKVTYLFPELKDWNEDLVAKKNLIKTMQSGGMSL